MFLTCGFKAAQAAAVFVALASALSAAANEVEANASKASGGAWEQLACTPQRTGYTPDAIKAPFEFLWEVAFEPELVATVVQPVVSGGRVFVPTLWGNVYAFDALTGEPLWTTPLTEPIVHTAAATGGRVFVASTDGKVYCLNAADGKPVWTFESLSGKGFSTAPLLAEDRLFIADRAGIVYALTQAEGGLVWKRELGAPVFQSAAYNDGRVVVGDEAMFVHSLNAADGAELWRSERLWGRTMRPYWPVTHKGKIYIRTFIAYYNGAKHFNPLPFNWGSREDLLTLFDDNPGFNLLTSHAKFLELGAKARDQWLDFMTQNPSAQNLFCLDEATGAQPFIPMFFPCPQMSGMAYPPTVDRDGYLVAGTPFTGCAGTWGRLNPETGVYEGVYFDERMLDSSLPNHHDHSGSGNEDETVGTSCAGDAVFAMHIHENDTGSAHYTGAYDLETQRWTRIRRGYIWPTFEPKYRHVLHKDAKLLPPRGVTGGTHGPSIANGIMYHIKAQSGRGSIQDAVRLRLGAWRGARGE